MGGLDKTLPIQLQKAFQVDAENVWEKRCWEIKGKATIMFYQLFLCGIQHTAAAYELLLSLKYEYILYRSGNKSINVSLLTELYAQIQSS